MFDIGKLEKGEAVSGILQITPWERMVLRLLASGSAPSTIGDHLGMSERAVDAHVASLFAKLGVATKTDAVAAAVRRGLLDVDG